MYVIVSMLSSCNPTVLPIHHELPIPSVCLALWMYEELLDRLNEACVCIAGGRCGLACLSVGIQLALRHPLLSYLAGPLQSVSHPRRHRAKPLSPSRTQTLEGGGSTVCASTRQTEAK